MPTNNDATNRAESERLYREYASFCVVMSNYMNAKDNHYIDMRDYYKEAARTNDPSLRVTLMGRAWQLRYGGC